MLLISTDAMRLWALTIPESSRLPVTRSFGPNADEVLSL